VKRDTSVFIKHILESIERIEEYVKEISEKQFFEETQVQDAIIRRIEIIGEATKNLPNGFRKKHSEVPWSEITGARDKLIHGYFGVDLDLTWDIVKKDLPDLKEKVEKILKEIEETKDKK